jgi:hypothetical protein
MGWGGGRDTAWTTGALEEVTTLGWLDKFAAFGRCRHPAPSLCWLLRSLQLSAAMLGAEPAAQDVICA